MPLFSFAELDLIREGLASPARRVKAAATLRVEQERYYPIDYQFDIFLSHSYQDVQIDKSRTLALAEFFDERGYEVYIDWLIDKERDRTNVTAESARRLRKRMDHCKCLVFAASVSAQHSIWMPWELGYMDGITCEEGSDYGKVSILPIGQTGRETFERQEYLGLYPSIDKAGDSVFVNFPSGGFVTFDDWLEGDW